MGDGITITLEIDVDEESMDNALAKAIGLKNQVGDPNYDNTRIMSLRRR